MSTFEMRRINLKNVTLFVMILKQHRPPTLTLLSILTLCPEICFVLSLLVVKLSCRNSAFQPQYFNPFYSYVEEISIAFPYHYIKVASNPLNISSGCFLS